MAKDYYTILGVPRGATKEEIQKAFHKMAHKYHPDKKGGDEAKFKEVNEAYQILSDEKKRRQYDSFGNTDGGMGGGGFSGGWDFSNFAQNGGFSAEGGPASGWEFDLGSMFGDIFSGAMGARGGKRRGRDISVEIAVGFSEAVFGATRKILINKQSLCQHCGGKGGEPGSPTAKCKTCDGRGQVRESRRSSLGAFTTVRECSACRGAGEVPEQVCRECRGAGAVNRAEEITVVIPPGINDGEMIRLTGQGEAAPRGVAGDLYVRVHVEKHPTLTRDGLNLRAALSIKLTEALLGTEKPLHTLDGQLTVKVPAGINHGEVLRVRGQGVPDPRGKRGDLLIRVDIKMPAKLSKKSKTLIEELKEEGV